MSVAITIRNVPDEVRNQLAARAALHGWSLQHYLLVELEQLATRQSNTDIIRRARARLTEPGPTGEQILAERDLHRR